VATRTFRVTAGIGWRSAGWPFGRIDVSPETITLRSRFLPLPVRVIQRQDIDAIEVWVLSGAARLRIRPVAGMSMERLSITTSSTRPLSALNQAGYRLEPTNKAARRMAASAGVVM